jgi:hypothetical protein
MSRAKSWAATVACVCVVAAVAIERLHAFAHAPPTDFDDAFMFVRYADHLRAGAGLTWNVGEPPVYGVTGLVHVVVVAAVRAARPAWSDAGALRFASVAAAVAALAVLAAACARVAKLRGLAGRPLAWAALLAPLAYSEAFVFHAESGMDTMSSLLANACLTYAVARLLERPSRAAALACALVAWTAVLARPDNALLAFGVPLFAIFLRASSPRSQSQSQSSQSQSQSQSQSSPSRRALAIAFVVPFALLVGADLAVKRALLGTALPLAFYAKRPRAYAAFAGEWGWNPFWFLACFFRAAAPCLFALLVFARRAHARVLFALLAPVVLTFAGLFYVNQIMGHLGRFYFPALPWLAFAVAGIMSEYSLINAGGARRWVGRAAVAVVVMLAGARAVDAAGRWYERRGERDVAAAGAAVARVTARAGGTAPDGIVMPAAELPELDSWRASVEMARLAADAPRGTVFAMSEHGLVGARAPDAIIVDLVGLHDRAFALGGFSARELMRRRPALIWMPHWDYGGMIRALLDDAELRRDFVFYPDAFTYGVAVRKDARALRELLAARFAAAYPGRALDDYAARFVATSLP